jgi:hypothetical protein
MASNPLGSGGGGCRCADPWIVDFASSTVTFISKDRGEEEKEKGEGERKGEWPQNSPWRSSRPCGRPRPPWRRAGQRSGRGTLLRPGGSTRRPCPRRQVHANHPHAQPDLNRCRRHHRQDCHHHQHRISFLHLSASVAFPLVGFFCLMPNHRAALVVQLRVISTVIRVWRC